MERLSPEAAKASELWPELEVKDGDLIVDKTRFGAFVPGSSNLHDLLQERGIETPSSPGPPPTCAASPPPGDAMQMNYQVISSPTATRPTTMPSTTPPSTP